MDMFDTIFSRRLSGRLIALAIITLLFLPQVLLGQDEYVEEIIVQFHIPRLLTRDIFVQYDGETIYLPLIEVFSLLDIPVESDFDNGLFTGSFLGDGNSYRINLWRGSINCFGQQFDLDSSAYYVTETDLFLRLDIYNDVFEMPMNFSFSSLRIHLPLDTDFPAYQRLKRKMAHENLKREVTVEKDVKDMPMRREYIKGAVADWMVSASPVGRNRIHYFNLNAGGVLMGGDMSISANGNTSAGLQTDQMTYRWRYYFGDSPYLRQAELGDINTDGAFTRALQGLQLSNKPIVRRKYFQTVRIDGFAGRNWEVELYINNKLTDFVYTDQAGEYSFLVDVNYGSSRILLKKYGPNGEIETEEQYLRTPYNLLPQREFEYTFAVGKTRYDATSPAYAQGNAYYGVLPNLTVGLNSELPLGSKEQEQPTMAAEVDYRPIGSVILSGSFSPNNEARLSLSYSEPSIVSLSCSYTKFSENKFRNRLNQLHGLVLSASSPIRIGKRYIGLRYYMSWDKFPDRETVSMNYGINSTLLFLHLTYTGKYKVSKQSGQDSKDVSSQVMASIRYLRLVNPQFRMDYNHTENRLEKYSVNLVKRVFRSGQLTLGYERNAVSGLNQINLTFSMFTNFASFTTKMLNSGGQFQVNQSQRGSIQYDQDGGRIRFDRRSSVGFGTAVIRPFLDENGNDELDEGEEYLSGLKAKIQGMSGRPTGTDRIYYYDRLRPYDEYLVGIDEVSLDNPLLKPAHENYKVTFSPNVVTSINVPLVMGGEVSGFVKRRTGQGDLGIGGIRVIFVNLSRESVTEVMSFNNGDFYFLGLVPGKYRAYIDPDQLKRYGYVSEPNDIKFDVKPMAGGAIIEDVDFLLVPNK